MLNNIFREGDVVYYGTTPGILLGIFDTNQALFYSDNQRQTFQTFGEMIKNNQQKSSLFFGLVKKHFSKLSKKQSFNDLLNRQKFNIIALCDLKKVNIPSYLDEDMRSLITKRHLYIRMLHHQLKKNDIVKFHEYCDKIENIQFKLEQNSFHQFMQDAL